MVEIKKGKELDFKISDRVITTDTTDTIRDSLIRAAIELTTNPDDSYKRLENKNAPVSGIIDIEYERKKDTAILKFRDFAEGMSEDELETKVRTSSSP